MIKDRVRRILLHAACSSNMKCVVRQLLRMGFDVKAIDEFKTTMLHEVARTTIERRNPRSVRFLICKEAEVQAKHCHGSTPLHIAAASGNSVLVRLFTEHGAEFNTQNRLRSMLLHSVLMYIGYGESVKMSISNVADVNATNNRGCIPRRGCIQKHKSELPIIQPQAQDTVCECTIWKLDESYSWSYVYSGFELIKLMYSIKNH